MAHDHAHEQLNAVTKGDGGVIGVTENQDAYKTDGWWPGQS